MLTFCDNLDLVCEIYILQFLFFLLKDEFLLHLCFRNSTQRKDIFSHEYLRYEKFLVGLYFTICSSST
jgi:hypothetical protein